jgi:hypothetical protein
VRDWTPVHEGQRIPWGRSETPKAGKQPADDGLFVVVEAVLQNERSNGGGEVQEVPDFHLYQPIEPELGDCRMAAIFETKVVNAELQVYGHEEVHSD